MFLVWGVCFVVIVTLGEREKTMSNLDLAAFKAEVRSLICGRLCKDSNAMWMASHLVKECEAFIRYVAENFSTDHKEANKCAVGILARRDSQSHPERYMKFDMSSMLDVHRLARLILEREDIVAISQLEDDVITELNKEN